jgi:hypothetical protein
MDRSIGRVTGTGIAFLSILSFFYYFSRDGLGAYFSGDDVMNLVHLHGYFTESISHVFLDVLKPVTAAYRPVGGVFYRVLYALAGFNPAPFHYVAFGLLSVNLAIAFYFFRKLAGSVEVALLATLMVSYHAEMTELYFSTGTIYDILCCTFYLLALILYLQFREAAGGLRPGAMIALLVLDLLALQSKEMAYTLPAVLLLCEWHQGPSGQRWGRSAWPALLGRFYACFLTGVLTLAAVLYKLLWVNAVSVNPAYQPVLSLEYFLRGCARYQSLLLYSPGLLSPAGLLGLWLALAALAFLARSRTMAVGLAFWVVTLIPVALIANRGGFVMYIPSLGAALYAAALLARCRAALVRVLARCFRAGSGGQERAGTFRLASQAAVFVLLMAGLASAHTARRALVLPELLKSQAEHRNVIEAVYGAHPTLKKGARILFTEDDFAPEDWYLTFALQLRYNDSGIRVNRDKHRLHARLYDYVFRDSAGHVEELPVIGSACPPPLVAAGVLDDESGSVCYQGAWYSGEFPAASEGTVTYTSQKGDSVEVAFRGSSLKYVYTKASNRGRAEVRIDGVAREVIDLYSPTVVWQASSTFAGLSPGSHSAVIRVLGTKRSEAIGSFVDLDAFVIE